MAKSVFRNSIMNLSAGDIYSSHLGGGIIDLVEISEGFKAPFDCQLVYKYTDDGHTCVFKSINPVEIPCQSTAITVSFRCTHMNDVSQLIVGTTFSAGAVVYYPGTAGQATGSHIHLQFARYTPISPGVTGLITNYSSGQFRKIKTNNTTNPDNVLMPWDAMYIQSTTTLKISDGSLDYKADYLWTEEGGRIRNMRGINTTTAGLLYLHTANNTLRLRQSASKQSTSLAIIPMNTYLVITAITNWVDDENFAWGYTSYNGQGGWVQIDSNYYFLTGKNIGITLKMRLYNGTAAMRDCPRGTIVRSTIPNNAEAVITECLGYANVDGYRWVKVNYGSYSGYIQYDPEVMCLKGTSN